MNESQATLSKDAKTKTALANDASAKVTDGDGASHERAASAHYDAKYANERAGNATQAKKHAGVAAVHYEKADNARRVGSFAADQARVAEQLSQKAEKAAYGKDENDPRSEKELHKDAADAHDKAGEAAKMAGKDKDAAYHADKAAHHAAAT